MLHILNYEDLITHHADLAHSMFVDRAEQFSSRLKWDVTVDGIGEERDQYDTVGTEYIVFADEANRHIASMRFRPTIMKTMAEEHFAELWPESIADCRTLECTRFLAKKEVRRDFAELIFASHTYCLSRGVTTVVGVYEAGMERIYDRLGWAPLRLRHRGSGRRAICSGKWSVDLSTYEKLRSRAGLPQSRLNTIIEACMVASDRANSNYSAAAGSHLMKAA